MADDDEHPPIYRGRVLGEGASDTVFCTCNECKLKRGELEEQAPIKPDEEPKVELEIITPAKIVDGEVSRD